MNRSSIWVPDIADDFVNTTVTGWDLSPIQRPAVPRNVFFYVEDMGQDFVDYDEKYDLIHTRGLDGSIRDWPRLYAQCLRCLEPEESSSTQNTPTFSPLETTLSHQMSNYAV